MVAHSTRPKSAEKPTKPRPDFPLFPHARGYWAKKVRGKLIYFGKVADDPKGEAALNLWLDQKDALLAGRTPRDPSDGLTVRDVCNHFLTFKEEQRDCGELAAVMCAARRCSVVSTTMDHLRLSRLCESECKRQRGWRPLTRKAWYIAT
jgi:hypothetical protein